MIIVGYYAIASEKFSKINEIEEIERTEGIVWFDVRDDKMYSLSRHCLQNSVSYAVRIDSVKDLLVYASLGAKYVLLQKAPERYQKIVESYMLDVKILYIIEEIEEIEEIAQMGIDGVIFEQFLEKDRVEG
ncbi:hypothetical protein [Helicobacter anatolicus]|uniref:hypothetical protein n=1 Tax=Helicobacter anatolicus TaxID=2905874 RepID=UPI001E55147F|nr:hypothetical protein [Helicobacter anatolicus]MCE3038953.1 hypothetical protein [Helicobacter anatolicus]